MHEIVDTSGNVLDRLTYSPFGELLTETNPANGDRFKYAGGAFDAVTGLIQFGLRYVESAPWTWDVGSAFTCECGDGLYSVGTGIGHTAYDFVAAPVDFVGFEAAWATGGLWKDQSYLGESLEQAFDNGAPLGSVLWNAEKSVATLGLWGLADRLREHR